jgi:hypothetical protein
VAPPGQVLAGLAGRLLSCGRAADGDAGGDDRDRTMAAVADRR